MTLASPMPAKRITLAKQALESCHLCYVLWVKSESQVLSTLSGGWITHRCEYQEAQMMRTTLENENWIRGCLLVGTKNHLSQSF